MPRTLARLAAVLALALVVAGLVPPAEAAVGRLSLSVPASVTSGSTVTVRGTLLTAAGEPVPGVAVTLESRRAGTTTWSGVVRATTDAMGAWSAKAKVVLTTEVRARSAASTTADATTSVVRTVVAKQSVKIAKVSPSRPAIGQKVTISGTTSAPLRGTTVTLQRKVSGVWSAVGSAKVSATGAYAVKVRVKTASALVLRVRSTSTSALAQATSPQKTVTVAVSGTLAAGQALGARRVLSSPDGRYAATMGTDGALVVRGPDGQRLWSSGTTGSGVSLRLGTDGNLSIGTADRTLWSTGTTAKDARLVMQNDGNLALYSRGTARWSSVTGLGSAAKPAACWSTSFDCISFSSYVPSTSWWRMYTGHNCTNYVAYRMVRKGVKTPPWGLPGGSAWKWRAAAKKAGVRVDSTPAVGAVMQWNKNTNGGGSSGHVVYVEAVTPTSVVISEDSWSSHSAVRTILRTSTSFKNARFLHIKDS